MSSLRTDLQDHVDDAIHLFATGSESVDIDNYPEQNLIQSLVTDCHKSTNHMEAALASSGPYMASLERDVLPDILENAEKLEELFLLLDTMNDEILPEVEASITRMEQTANILNKDRISLEPSKLKQMISYFGTKAPTVPEPRPEWHHPEIFDTGQLMSKLGVEDGQDIAHSSLSNQQGIQPQSTSQSTQSSVVHNTEQEDMLPNSSPIGNDIMVQGQGLCESDDDDDDVEVI